MNIKDSYIHNGTAVLKDVKVENSVLKKILAGKDANDAYLGWETVCDLTGIKPKAAGTADKVGHKLTFSGGVTGTWDGSADKTVAIPTKSSWNYDDVYLKLTGNGTTNPLTGTIYIKDVNGIILNSSNKDLNIWEVYGNSGAWASQYGFNLQYLGTGEGNSNDLILWAHNQTGTHVESYRVKQDGTFIFKAAPKVGTNVIYHAGNLTIKTLMGTTAIGDADEPVYWNGSSFVKAGAYPTKASWNYDDRYLKLSGGTLTGVLHLLGSKYEDSANTGALDLANSDIYGVNSIKFADLAESAGEGLQWYRDATHVDSLWVKNGVIYFSPNRTWGGSVTNYTVWHSGNDGSGSGLDADLLDGKHASDFSLSTHTHDYIAKLRRLNEVFGYSSFASGMFPPTLFELKTAGYPVYSDPEFASGYNSVNVYNNYGNGTVTITREHAGDHTNSSGFQLKITTAGEATPGCGGFYQSISSRANAIFVQIFRAKIPVGYNVNTASNSMGTNYQDKFITDRAGTGKWEWYARVVYCASSGSFSSGGHVYLSANSGYSATSVTWYLSYCNLIDITKGAYDGLRTRYADSADSVVWSNITKKPTTINGYGITDALKIDGSNGTADGVSTLINKLSVGSSIPTDTDYYICQYVGGETTTTTYHRRPMSAMWNWIKAKTDTLYPSKTGTGASGVWEIGITGNAKTATKLQTARTIWGQSFDGTKNISGALTEVTDITASGNINCANLKIPSDGKIYNGGYYGLYVNSSAGDYGSAIYLTHDHGKNQTAFRIHSHYDSNLGGLTIGFSTTTQNYGESPINATYDDILHIRGNGNIGIGTTSPSYKLHVVGDVYTTTGFKKKDSSNSYVLLGGGGHKLVSDFSVAHDHPYLPLSGGIMSNTNVVTNLNADLLDGYHAHNFAFAENTYGTTGNFVNGIEGSNYIARGDLGLVGFDNSAITVELYEATSSNSYSSSPTKIINTSDSTYGVNFRKGTYAVMHSCAAGSKLKIIVKSSSGYIKAVGIYINLGGNTVSFSSTVGDTVKTGSIHTYGSWHLFSCMNTTLTSITLELNTTNVNCGIIIGGFRTYITNPNYLRFPGIANSADSVSWTNITNKPSSFTPATHTHTFASLTSKPTTINGYGITDAYTKTEVNSTLRGYLPLSGGIMTGDISWNTDKHGIYFYRGCGIEKWPGYGPTLIGEGDSAEFNIRSGTDRTKIYPIIHTGNYKTYCPTKTGEGASGTWGISISGNAVTATNASYATSAGNADTVDNYHAMSAGSLFYKYEVTATIPASSVTGDFWYATITFERSYVKELTRSMLDTSYSNIQGQVYLNTYEYNGAWYAFATSYNGCNIKGISYKNVNNPIYYIKLAKPKTYNNTLPAGNITVYSPYNCTITVSATAPSGVTFTNINCPGFTNFKANSAYNADSATTSTYASNVGSSGTAGTNYVTASKVIAACNWYDTMIGSDSDTVINRWSEIVAFVAGFKETPDLATFLSNNYLAKAGGTMTGLLKWANATALPQQTSPQYFLCIDAFDDGGTTKWTSKADTLKALTGLTSTAIGDSDEPVYWNGNKFVKAGAYPTKSSWNYDDKYLKLSGGTLTGVLTINTASDRSFILDEPTGEKYHIISFRAKGEEYASLCSNYLNSENNLIFNGNIIYHSGNLPAYPTVNNGSLYLQANGTTKVTFTANQADNSTLNIATGSANGTISVGGTNVSVKGLGSNAYSSTAYLPLVGGTMDDNAQIKRKGRSGSWVGGRDRAIIRETSSSGYHPLFSLKTKDGSWELGEYNTSGLYNVPIFSYVTDTDYSNGNNTTTYQIKYPLASGTIALTADLKWSNISSKPETATRWPSWSEITNKPSTFPVSEHNHDGRYLRWNGSAADVSAMAWGTLTAANGYTILSHAASSDGGDWGMVNKGGKIYMQLDGYYYQNEGQYRVTDVSETVTALGTNGNYLTWTKNGSTSNITVPYASNAESATNANYFLGCTNTITVAGDANTYYPVMVSTTANKKFSNIITVWKDLGSKTASYQGNHSNGSSSMLYRYDIRNCYWDGNGGYCTTLDARYMYARLVSETRMLSNGVGNFCIWLRGGGTEYRISTSWNISSSDITVYYSSTNVGSSTYPVTIEPKTDIGNGGIYNTISIPCEVKYASYAGSVSWNNVTGKPATATRWPSWSEVTDKPTFTTWSEISSVASYSLSNAAWTNTITLPTTAGSYILNIVSGNSTLTGVFSIGSSDNAKDEISLHLHGNGPRLYARTNGTTLQLSSNDASATSRSVTIKYRRMI